MVKVNGREMTKEQFRNYILAEMKRLREEKKEKKIKKKKKSLYQLITKNLTIKRNVLIMNRIYLTIYVARL